MDTFNALHRRACALLQYVDASEAILRLTRSDVPLDIAYLAVKGAQFMIRLKRKH